MKIAIVAPLVTAIREPQRGGSQVFVADLAAGLTRRGHDVHLYAASGSEIPGVTVIDTGVDPDGLAGALYRAVEPAASHRPAALAAVEAAFSSAYAQVQQTRYDVVHNHAFDAPAIRLAAALRAPVLHTLHLPPAEAVATALRRAARSPRPPVVATVSEFQARAWRKFVPVDAVLLPTVPTASIPWSAVAGQGIVFAGRLSPEKGVAEAIDIATAAGLPIDVYGDAYDAPYAHEKIGPRAVRPGVTVHAAVPRAAVWEVMARAAVVLYPVLWDEPFGMAAAEAQACGTPVVAFRRGGLGEVIADGVTGFLVPPGDARAANAAVGQAAGLSRRACRSHAERQLDLSLSLDAHEHVYQRMLSKSGRETGGA
jgi:glycosyltransferase involved in cell wall biosynthesis